VQALVFHVGPERYAVPAGSVAEVVPSVPLRRVPGTPEPVAGLFDYRGHVVPVVDLCRLFGEGPCPARLSSRIVVVDLSAGEPPGSRPPHARFVGALAERVLSVEDLDPTAADAHPGPTSPGVPALGTVVRDDEGLVQLVRVSALLPPDLLASLSAGNVEGGT
jgi:chemotaxis-related protein WspB